MSGELVFTISGGDASPSVPVTFAEAGLREREHLQEWVLAYPQILGEDLRIVSFEFDRWLAGTGEPTYDRLDVLALDRGGRLVVAELKRDRAPTTVSMQALNYAAMVSRFNLDTLAEVYAAHRGREQLPSEQALAELGEWAPELSDETLGPPRIVLVATDFGPQVTNTSLFLYGSGIDIRLVRAQLYPAGIHGVEGPPLSLPVTRLKVGSRQHRHYPLGGVVACCISWTQSRPGVKSHACTTTW